LNLPRGLFPFSVASYLKNNAPRKKNCPVKDETAEKKKRKKYMKFCGQSRISFFFRMKVSKRVSVLVLIHFFLLFFVVADAVSVCPLLPCSSGYKSQTPSATNLKPFLSLRPGFHELPSTNLLCQSLRVRHLKERTDTTLQLQSETACKEAYV
jgi:hypothetical protein